MRVSGLSSTYEVWLSKLVRPLAIVLVDGRSLLLTIVGRVIRRATYDLRYPLNGIGLIRHPYVPRHAAIVPLRLVVSDLWWLVLHGLRH